MVEISRSTKYIKIFKKYSTFKYILTLRGEEASHVRATFSSVFSSKPDVLFQAPFSSVPLPSHISLVFFLRARFSFPNHNYFSFLSEPHFLLFLFAPYFLLYATFSQVFLPSSSLLWILIKFLTRKFKNHFNFLRYPSCSSI